MILDDIVKQKKVQLEKEKQKMSIMNFKQRLKSNYLNKTIDFFSSIKLSNSMSIIAEIKKASPSKGIFRDDFDPVLIAKEYIKSKVQAISVITEKNYFLGADEFLVKVRQSTAIPILRKDFIVDLWQVYQSRFLGADAILLIVSILSDEELKKFKVVADIIGIQSVFEVHNEREIERALEAQANIIGINNRDLLTFEVDLSTTSKLINHIPSDKAVISESGINNYNDLQAVKSFGADAVLIGEAFMTCCDIPKKILQLRYN